MSPRETERERDEREALEDTRWLILLAVLALALWASVEWAGVLDGVLR